MLSQDAERLEGKRKEREKPTAKELCHIILVLLLLIAIRHEIEQFNQSICFFMKSSPYRQNDRTNGMNSVTILTQLKWNDEDNDVIMLRNTIRFRNNSY